MDIAGILTAAPAPQKPSASPGGGGEAATAFADLVEQEAPVAPRDGAATGEPAAAAATSSVDEPIATDEPAEASSVTAAFVVVPPVMLLQQAAGATDNPGSQVATGAASVPAAPDVLTSVAEAMTVAAPAATPNPTATPTPVQTTMAAAPAPAAIPAAAPVDQAAIAPEPVVPTPTATATAAPASPSAPETAASAIDGVQITIDGKPAPPVGGSVVNTATVLALAGDQGGANAQGDMGQSLDLAAAPAPASDAPAAEGASLFETLLAMQTQPAADRRIELAVAPQGGDPQAVREALADGGTVQITRVDTLGESRIRIELHPAELGSVEIRMELTDDGDYSAKISVERPQTLELLQRDVRTLERLIQDAGMRAADGGISFSLRDGGQQGGQRLPFEAASAPVERGPQEQRPAATPAFVPVRTAADARIDISV